MTSARLRAYIELLIAIVIWGIGASVIKFALGSLSPFVFLSYRFFLTVLVLFPFFLLEKKKHISLKDTLLLILIAFLGSTFNLGLYFYGTKLSTSIDASLITATAPILIIVGSVLFLREHITHREKIGIAITMIGTFVIMLQSSFEHGSSPSTAILGNILLFACNIAFAAYLILSKELLRDKISPFTLTFATFLVGFITTLPLTLLETKASNILPVILHLNLSTQLSVIYMAVLSGAVAYFLYQRAQKTIEVSEASIFQYLQPLATAPVAAVWLGERVTIPMIAGSFLIAIGVFLAEWKKRKKTTLVS
jgi:drug/metabolite transporter (DMT)-like permease